MSNQSSSKALIEVKDLSIGFKNGKDTKEVVHGISFAINTGEIVGLVGESGSGKTVTGLSILKLLPEHSAVVNSTIFTFEEGVQLDQVTEKEMEAVRGKQIAMIFQEPMSAFNPVMTCGKQVIEVLTLHLNKTKQEAKNRVLELFQEVNLPDPNRAFNSYPHQLSGGQLQRIMIAMAVACDPALIIADEPTTALDVTIQQGILDLLQSMNTKYGLSILMISHDLGVIANICDRVMVMKQGEIVESGSTDSIFNSPSHPYTQGLLACRPTIKTTGNRLPELNTYLNQDKADHQNTKAPSSKSNTELLISASNLTKIYQSKDGWFGKTNETIAVNNVSLDLYSGKVLGLVGESGCGKTTLSNLLLGLDNPNSGSLTFMGNDYSTFGKKEWKAFRKDVQVVFQNPYSSLNPKMKIGNIIKEPMDIHNVHFKSSRKDKVVDLLEKVGLDADAYDRSPVQFSGGQRQRIVIARALASEPRLVICDESVSALDVSIQASIINLLLDLKDEFNLGYLFISHDLRVVKFVSDEIIVMQNGEIVEYGDPTSLFANPQQAYTRTLIDSIPKV